jgi:hypothetical protein
MCKTVLFPENTPLALLHTSTTLIFSYSGTSRSKNTLRKFIIFVRLETVFLVPA